MRNSPPVEIHETQHLSLRDVLPVAFEELINPPPGVTLPDWTMFNRLTGGFRMNEYSILCGSTGAGKTTLLANISAQLLKSNTKHFVMSVEIGHTAFMKRVLGALAQKDYDTGEKFEPNELARVHAANDLWLTSDAIEFSLYDNRVSLEQLLYDLENMVKRYKCKVAFIDNLNFFMNVTRQSDAIYEMDRITHELIMFCKAHAIHIVMVMHPNKSSGNPRVESEFDIKGSSTAVQEAQNVFLFNRPNDEALRAGTMDPTDRELTINKMRRRGINQGKTLMFKNLKTQYIEKGICDFIRSDPSRRRRAD